MSRRIFLVDFDNRHDRNSLQLTGDLCEIPMLRPILAVGRLEPVPALPRIVQRLTTLVVPMIPRPALTETNHNSRQPTCPGRFVKNRAGYAPYGS